LTEATDLVMRVKKQGFASTLLKFAQAAQIAEKFAEIDRV
jgi:hypothetical protein